MDETGALIGAGRIAGVSRATSACGTWPRVLACRTFSWSRSCQTTRHTVDGAASWRFIGVSRYDGVLAGGLTKGEVVRVQVDPALISILDDTCEPLAAHPLGLGPPNLRRLGCYTPGLGAYRL